MKDKKPVKDIRFGLLYVPNTSYPLLNKHPPRYTIPPPVTLGGDKVSMLVHTYPHKPLRKSKWSAAISRLRARFMCGLMSDLVICKFRKTMVIHDTECPY